MQPKVPYPGMLYYLWQGNGYNEIIEEPEFLTTYQQFLVAQRIPSMDKKDQIEFLKKLSTGKQCHVGSFDSVRQLPWAYNECINRKIIRGYTHDKGYVNVKYQGESGNTNGILPIDTFIGTKPPPLPQSVMKTKVESKVCKHSNVYKNIISINLKFLSCSDCGADLGDIE